MLINDGPDTGYLPVIINFTKTIAMVLDEL